MFQTNFFRKETLKEIVCVTASLAIWFLTFMVSPEKANAQSIETYVNSILKDSEWVYEGDTLEVDLKAFDANRSEVPSASFRITPLENIDLFERAEITNSQANFTAQKGASGKCEVTFNARIGGRDATKNFNIEVRREPVLKPYTISFYEYEKNIEEELKTFDPQTDKEISINWKFAKEQEKYTTKEPDNSLDTENFKATIKDNKSLFIEAKKRHVYEEEGLRKGKIILVNDEYRLTKDINVEIKPLEKTWLMSKLVKTLGWRRTGHILYDYFVISGDTMIFLFIAFLILVPSIIWKGGQLYWWIFNRKAINFKDQLTRAIRPGEWKKVPDSIIEKTEKKDFNGAIDDCENEEHPVVSVLKVAIQAKVNIGDVGEEIDEEERDRQMKLLEEEMGKERDRQVERLEKWFWAFDVIILIAPMLGFLGTITGLILAFRGWMADLAAGIEVDMANLAGGMYQAMITTFVGLFIAIYAIFFNSIYRRRFDKLSAAMVEFSNRIAEVLCKKRT